MNIEDKGERFAEFGGCGHFPVPFRLGGSCHQ